MMENKSNQSHRDEEFHSLRTILSQMVGHHRELLNVVGSEAELPSFASLEKLQDVQKRRENKVQEIRSLEEKRIEVVKEIAAKLNLDFNVTLKELIPYCSSEEGGDLSSIHKELLSLVQKIQKEAKSNSVKALTNLRSLMEIQRSVQKTLQNQVVYSEKGVISQPKEMNLLRKKYA